MACPTGTKSRDEFVVENILAMKDEGGVKLYLIKWLGYESAHNTWEPLQNLSKCEILVRSFESGVAFGKSLTTGEKNAETLPTSPKTTFTDPIPVPIPFYLPTSVHPETSVSSGIKGNRKGKRPFSCSTCGKKFLSKVGKTLHEKAHTDGKEHKCTLCGMEFQERCTMNKHIRLMHLRERPFSCEFCSKAFADTTSLKKHLKAHSQ